MNANLATRCTRTVAILAAITMAQAAVGTAAADDDFESMVAPFLTDYCVDCHQDGSAEADIVLDSLEYARLGSDDAETWHAVVEALAFHQMPPPVELQPAPAERAEVVHWIESELQAAGRGSDVLYKLQQPEYANLLNHDKLFDGSITDAAFSPSRLWRFHPEAYELFLAGFGRELTIGGPLSKPFTVRDEKGQPSNYAALMQADSATLGQLLLNCEQIADVQTIGFIKQQKDRQSGEMVDKLFRRMPESFAAIIEGDEPVTDELLQNAVKEEFQLVLTRPPSEEELSQFTTFLVDSIEIGGKEKGLRNLALAVLLRPESIYRMEVGLGAKTEDGRRMLSPYELAYAIAFALTDTPPDALMLGPERSRRLQRPSLMDLAANGELETREDVRRVVLQIWENEKIEKPRILRFFREFFGYHAAETVFKGDRAGREFAPKHLVKDADDLVMYHVQSDSDVLKELLTTDRYFVTWAGSQEDYDRRIKYITDRIKPDNVNDRNYRYFIERTNQGLRPMPQANPTWRATVRFYNLHEDTWDYPLDQPFVMPEGQRVGILTHPAWLAAWSGNFDNDPIRRGKWIRENLLAGSVPEVPITVDASVPEDPHKTLRQRLEKTRDAYCWQCHQNMDPLGLPFESYDDFGQFRVLEGLGSPRALSRPKDTAPVDSSGKIIDSGESQIDGDVADVHELMQRLADSSRVRQSFVRHAFRYWMGRNELISDSSVLMAADREYVENGGSFKSLVVELLTSDSFLYRR